MQVANRTTRRYITPPTKTSAGNIRPTIRKHSSVPTASHSSPKKAVETQAPKPNENSTLKKLVDRFRYDEPQPRPERESMNSDFWWLHDELKTTCESNADDDDDRKSNLPEFIEIFPSTDIDQDLNKRASLLLNQTFSAHSSDIGHVSSTGIGSTASTTMTTTTTSTFQPVVHEQPARPIFTRITDSRLDFKVNGGSSDEDILYQWRLRRRLEQAQNNEPITFPSKITNRNNISPSRSHFPSIPIEIPTVIPPPPSAVESASAKLEKPPSETSINKIERLKQSSPVPLPIRQYAEATTQTLQDACIQTSPIVENCLSISTVVPNDLYLRPTRDDYDDHSSVWHRPPPRSKSDATRISSSPSPIKRHHHQHHHHHSFRPVVVGDHPASAQIPHQRSVAYPSMAVQSSQDSTLTQVTSIMINDGHHHHPHTDHQYQMRNPSRVAMIDETHIQHQDDGIEDADGPVQYSNDEILNILIQKRDELLVTFREIDQRLATMNS